MLARVTLIRVSTLAIMKIEKEGKLGKFEGVRMSRIMDSHFTNTEVLCQLQIAFHQIRNEEDNEETPFKYKMSHENVTPE